MTAPGRTTPPVATATAAGDAPAWDLLLVLLGAPYAGDTVSTALTWARAAVAAGTRVQVWTCGYATSLSQAALGHAKVAHPLRRHEEHPTSVAWLDALVAEHPDRVRWLVCRFCSEERGQGPHVPAVRVRPAMSFVRHVRESAKTVVVGVV
ncbi:hypothetical protein [Cellulomonas shaoxiangyii]|uniref:DsrE family protein n=1 Tax=Cellulomonas shaoxiangyii TaxID=2566013 RepID=A0A4V1CMA8_9CELL|nr:hypothetical protein [Cellulomonas shaoxiangyii]QCB92295.1 hypothetical protein E5225_00705 [Cellulomonas shaoxiangyii]TGY85893.1 hypothetical protein E5226_04230 [Cellulomonas shaoxiangyii]